MRRLLVILVAATLLPFIVVSTPAEADAATPPIEMEFVCARAGAGLVRYVANLGECRRNETPVTIRPGPVHLCVGPFPARIATSPGDCPPAPGSRVITVPAVAGPTYFCVQGQAGLLRTVSDPSQCRYPEFPVVVSALDAPPALTGSAPADGATGVALNTDVVLTFNEPVSATAAAFTIVCGGAAKAFTLSGSPGSSLTLDPTTDVAPGTTCTVTALASGITDVDSSDPPDHPVADVSIQFTTDSAPAVTTTSPTNGATGVAAGTTITISFNEAVNAGPGAFTLECPAASLRTFSVTGSGTSVIVLDPDANLPAATVCVVMVLASGITDVDGGDPPDHPVADHVLSFTTSDAAPSVSATSPANGATHVAVDSSIVITFSEPVNAAAGAFSVQCPVGSSVALGVTGSPGTSITLDPTGTLPAGTTCTVTVFAGQIGDTDAVDPPDQMAADFVFSFATDAAPAVTATTPADGASGVAPAADLTINFSEPVNVGVSSFTLLCGGNAQPFAVSGSGTASITLNPTSDLPSTSSCTLTVVAANVSDVDSGDPPDHPAANVSVTFTTQDAAPSVTATSPANGATNVSRATDIVITFSEPVNAAAGAFTLECPTGAPIAFSVTGSGTATLTLNPTSDLPINIACTVTVIAAQVTDTDAVDPPDTMAANFLFSFSVAASQPPTDITLSNASVPENEPVGTVVGTLTTTDPDVGDTFTYTLVSGVGDTDNASFAIVGDSLRTNAVFNFETKSSYSVRIRSSDGSTFFEKAFTITVTDVNEAPVGSSRVDLQACKLEYSIVSPK